MPETPATDSIQPAMPPAWEPSGGMPALKITNVKTICTAPDGIRLVVVKVETSEPGTVGSLPGLRCGAPNLYRPVAQFVARPYFAVTTRSPVTRSTVKK